MEEHRGSSRVLLDVEFEPRLRTYTMVTVSLVLMITVVGIVLLPVWLIFGRRYVDRYYDNLFCQLTTKALHFKKGVWFHTEKTIPLDKIQDLTFKEGPVLRQFGLSYLQVETAGQTLQGASDMSLIGIVDARKFREAVLNQRDKITEKSYGTPDAHQSPLPGNEEVLILLKEISATLKRMEEKQS